MDTDRGQNERPIRGEKRLYEGKIMCDVRNVLYTPNYEGAKHNLPVVPIC